MPGPSFRSSLPGLPDLLPDGHLRAVGMPGRNPRHLAAAGEEVGHGGAEVDLRRDWLRPASGGDGRAWRRRGDRQAAALASVRAWRRPCALGFDVVIGFGFSSTWRTSRSMTGRPARCLAALADVGRPASTRRLCRVTELTPTSGATSERDIPDSRRRTAASRSIDFFLFAAPPVAVQGLVVERRQARTLPCFRHGARQPHVDEAPADISTPDAKALAMICVPSPCSRRRTTSCQSMS